ncbi:MAG: hypothetical protein WBA67_01810 [Jannaschia sp.]
MLKRFTSAILITMTLATGAGAMGFPTFTDIMPPIKMPEPQDTLSTRGK